MILHLVRILFLLVVTGIVIPLSFQAAGDKAVTFRWVAATVLVPVIAAFMLVLTDMLWRRKRLQVLSGLFFGALAGMVIAYGLSLVVDIGVEVFEVRNDQIVQLVKGVVGAATVFLCVSFVLQTKDDFRFIIPYVEFARQAKGARPMLLDTSAIIDGRIADIVETGVMESEIVVPRFVLNELQTVADSQDKLKRARGRRGLDILAQLQGSKSVDVRILDPSSGSVEKTSGVDEKLLALARQLDGRVITNDYNLNKVARLRGVKVVNVNDLASAMRAVYLPGEPLKVRIVRPGEAAGQGVGYLQDGTMVVVEQARDLVGKEVQVTVTSALQTSAGRMIFGRPNGQ
jgi:uncharacterized protein YacL